MSDQDRDEYEKNRFPANDDLYCPDCGGAKTKQGNEWHAWNCPRLKNAR